MQRISVVSSNLASVGYESSTGTLEVEFHSGAIYQYAGVPESAYNGLMNAASKGRYLDRSVKKVGYPAVRVA
jgi:hypothetical protein